MIIKVCGMRQADNIRAVEQMGADMMGFIFYPPSPRYVARRPDYLPHRQQRVGVFVDADEGFITARVAEFSLNALQLHGNETPETCRRLKAVTGCMVMKAMKITADFDFAVTEAYRDVVDMFVFDTPTVAVGGSGRRWDHRLMQRYKGATPFLLSGGLGPEDAQMLASLAHPSMVGIDVNSRFETAPAVKDAAALAAFIAAYRRQLAENSTPQAS